MAQGPAVSEGEQQAIAAWATFPVDVVPRPIVFLDSRVSIGPSAFSDSNSKIAFLHGIIRTDVDLPDGVLALLTRRINPQSSTSPLTITRVDRDEAEFRTDRGPRRLPAYRLDITGMREPCHVLDPTVSTWWPEELGQGAAGPSLRAHVDSDDLHLRLWAYGSILTEFDGVEFVEYETVVLARPQTHERASDSMVIPAVAVGGVVAGTLARPLGARVLIDERGTPYEVVANGEETA